MVRGRESILAVMVASIALALFWGYGPLDDDYIIYRYAERWIETGQLAYNPGQFVEGFSAPLWLLLISAGLKLGLRPDLTSQFLGILALLGCMPLFGRLWRAAHGPEVLAWPLLLFAALPAMAFHALGGLGTVPLAYLILAWAASWQAATDRGARPWAAAVFLGLACLMRAECALIVPFFLHTEWRTGAHRSRLLSSAVLALLPLAGWCLFRWFYYGEWLPNTYYVKRLSLWQDLGYGLRYLWDSTLNSGVGVWLCLLAPMTLAPGASPLQRCLARVVLVHALYVIAVGGDYIDMARFFVPMLPLMLLLAGGLLQALFGIWPVRLKFIGGYLLVLVLWPYAQLSHKQQVYEQNEGRWKLLGQELRRSLPEDYSVMLSPIGCVGYLSKLPIVDPLGLTHAALRNVEPNPQVTLKGHQRQDADWALAQRPAVFIPSNGRLVPNTRFLPLAWEVPFLVHRDLESNYHLIQMPVTGSTPLVCYLRRDLPLPPGASLLPQG